MASTALATAFVSVVPSAKGFGSSLNGQLNRELPGIGSKAGGTLGAALGSAFKRVAGPLIALASAAAIGKFVKDSVAQFEDLAGSVKKLQRITGGTVEEVSKMRGAMQLAGVPVDNINQSVTIFAKRLGMAAGSAKDTAAMNKLFGQSIKDSEGNVKSMAALLPGLADRFKSMPDGAQKTALATQLFGRAGANMIPVLNKGSAGIAELTDKAAKMGLVLDDAAMKTFTESKKSTREFAAAIQGLKVSLGADLLPVIEAVKNVFRNAFTPVLQGITKFLQDHRADFTKFADVLTGMGKGAQGFKDGLNEITKSITGWISGGGLTGMIQRFAEFRSNLIQGIAQALPDMISALGQAIATALPVLVQTLLTMVPQLLQTAQTLFTSLITAIQVVIPSLLTSLTNMLPKIVDQLVTMLPGLITGAVNLFLGLVNGLVIAIPQLLVALLNALPKILNALVTMLPAIINGAVQLFIGLVNGLVKVLPTLLTTLTTVVLPKLIQTIIALIPILITAAVTLFLALVKGLAQALPQIIAAVVKLVPEIVKALLSVQGQLVDAGFQVLKGLVKGIIDNAPRLIGETMKSIGGMITDTFKKVLGIHSPSKVFYEFGKNILDGLNEGLTGNVSDVQNTMKRVSEWVMDAFYDNKISKRASDAATALVGVYTAKLSGLATAHDKIVKDLTAAQDELTKRLDEKASFITSMSQKFGATLTLDNKSTAKSAIAELQARVQKSKELQTITDKLVQMGLNKDLLKQIAEAGAVDFAKSIIAGGQEAVGQLNVLADEASKQALALANQVGSVLFDEGIKFAQSVVDGLTSQESTISAMMARVADEFASRIAAIVQAGAAQAQAEQDLQNAKDAAASAKKTQDAAQSKYAAAVKKSGAKSTAAKSALTTLNKAKAATTAAQAAVATAQKTLANTNIPAFAAGGFVTKPTIGLIGEAGPEVVTPLKDFERMMGTIGGGQTVNYYAAPNNSLDSEQELFRAMKRAKAVA